MTKVCSSEYHGGLTSDVPARGLVVAHIVADEMAGDAELGVGFEVLVLGIVELRDQRLETRFVNQKVKMRRRILCRPCARKNSPTGPSTGIG